MPHSETDKAPDSISADNVEAMSLADMVFDTLHVGAAALDQDGNYIAADKYWAQLFGLADHTVLIGKNHFQECRTVLSRSEFEGVVAGTALREQLVEAPRTDEGSTVDGKADLALFWNAFPAANPNVACVVTVRSVDGAPEEVKQLIRDRDQLRFAIDGADYGLWDWNIVTGEVYFSRQFMKILGYEQFELPHSYDTWAVLCKKGEAVPVLQAIEDYEAAGEGFLEDEYQMVRKDGSFVWILSRGKIVSRCDDGSPLRVVGTHQDISVQKEREAALVQAKEEAIKANQTKSDFLALISHEIRTPLNGITSVLQLLGDEADADERKRLSQIALNSSDQLLTVLSDVLDVSKMEAGRFELNLRSVNLMDLVEELSQTHKKAIEAKGLTFSLVVNGDAELPLMMDPVRVTQIMSNFLSNAAKFTEKGSIALSVDVDQSYGAAKDNKVYLSFGVRDDGVGLTPSEREKLFQPFYQAEGTRSRSSEGTGLGLSICKKLAGLMGGTVWCASKKDVGSTFYFEAAFAIAETVTEKAASSEVDAVETVREGIRILAAEDNPVNQMMLKKFLVDRLNYAVVIAANGVEVIEALGKDTFDVVLMDIHMPVKDGVTTTQEIRGTTELWRDIPIIALTADAAQAHIDEYTAAGIDACVSKPVDWQHLDHMIQQIVK